MYLSPYLMITEILPIKNDIFESVNSYDLTSLTAAILGFWYIFYMYNFCIFK